MKEIDKIDKKILNFLKTDGRMSFRSIAEKIGKTEATVRRRVSRMKKEGVIKRFTVILGKESDKKQRAIIKIKTPINKVEEVSNKLANLKEVIDVWRLAGECGLFLRLEFDNFEDIDKLIDDKIAFIEDVEIIDTCFITQEIKINSN